MKKLLFICLLMAAHTLTMGAQEEDVIARRRALFANSNKKELDEKMLDKMPDLKPLVGKTICLRPDYGSRNGLTISRSYVVPIINQRVTEEYVIAYDDVLTVAKAKKNELTVMRNEDKIKIPAMKFGFLMLVSDRDEMTQALEAKRKARQEAAEKAKEEAKRAELQGNLTAYYESLKNMPTASSGPIVVETERAYDGTKPYWKGTYSEKNIDTFRDEKFVINPRTFRQEYEKKRKEIERHSGDRDAQQLAQIATMQTDTFGLFGNSQFINLRTGEVVGNFMLRKVWESTTYQENLNALPALTYDGTERLDEYLGGFERSYRERFVNALIGERVFLLDELKYDVIADVEESYGGKTVLYLQERGPVEDWTRKCIAVKWYEQLQKMVGKKVMHSRDIRYYGEDSPFTTWREDLAEVDAYTVESIEVKNGSVTIHMTGDGADALGDDCKLLAYPINVEAEWQKGIAGEESKLKYGNYLAYDAVMATTPKKPAAVRKRDAEYEARSAQVSKNFSDLCNHRYIGTSLASFLETWPYAQLVNTTQNGGVTVKVYYVHDYQLIFRNGKCVSQTKL